MPDVRVRLRFHGGCRDGRVFAPNLKSLSENHGYRYCLLALRGKVGTKWREVSITEYGQITSILRQYGPVERLSGEEVQEIVRQLQHLRTYVYEVKRRDEAPDEIAMVLDFIRVDAGV
jgi:hypothetical protein